MTGWILIAAAVVGLVLTGAVCRWLLRNPRGDVATGVVYHLMRWYARRVHRLRVDGEHHIPDSASPGPLIVVANHTSGVDPLLVQARCPFEIRWLMAEDMRIGWLEPFWKWTGVIFVDRHAPNLSSLRDAIAHLKGGGVIGIFPEGGIERPPRQVLPFMRGVGVLIKKSGAPILPVLVQDTPEVDSAWGSLSTTSRSKLRFGMPVRDDLSRKRPDAIADDLRTRFIEWSGWPANDVPQPNVPPGKPARD